MLAAFSLTQKSRQHTQTGYGGVTILNTDKSFLFQVLSNSIE